MTLSDVTVRRTKSLVILSVSWDERKLMIPTWDAETIQKDTIGIRALDLAAWCRKVKIKIDKYPVTAVRELMGWNN